MPKIRLMARKHSKIAARARRRSSKPLSLSLNGLIGRPTFNVKNVSAGKEELRIWFAWCDIARQLVMQRAVLSGLYHEALGFDRELPYVKQYCKRGERQLWKIQAKGGVITEHEQILDAHVRDSYDYQRFVRSASQRAAESIIYTLDSLIKYAGSAVMMVPGKKDANLIGGRYLAKGLTLLEAIRVIANWQRHNLEWNSKPFNQDNYNHVALQALGLWGEDDVPIAFLKNLKRRSYFQLERDLHGALEYLACEVGIRHPDQQKIDEERAKYPRRGRRG